MTAKQKRLTQEERTQLSDEGMYQSAAELVLDKGVIQTTLKEVGERAGYSRGLAQNRFGSKEQLFEGLVKRSYRHWIKELSGYIGNATGLEAYVRCVNAFEHFLLDSPQELQVLQVLWYHSITHQSVLQDKTRQYQENMVRDVERWMAEAKANSEISQTLDEHDFAMRHMSFIFGIVYMWLLNPDKIPVKKTFSSFLANALVELSP